MRVHAKIFLSLTALMLLGANHSVFGQAIADQAQAETATQLGLIEAKKLYEQGEYQQAVAILRGGVAQVGAENGVANGDEASAVQHLLGRALLAIGHIDDALAALRSAREQSLKPRLDIRYDIAASERTYRDRGAAEESLQRILHEYRDAPETFSSADTLAAGHAARLLAESDSTLYRVALDIFERAAATDEQDPQALVAIGDLLLDRYNNAEAQQAYRDALSRDSDAIAALFGLARSAHFDHSPQALDQIRAVVKKRPNLVAARAFQARLHMDLDEYEEADTAITAALGINPNAPDALALKAGLQYLRDEPEAFATTYRTLRATAPGYLELYETVAEIAAQNRRYNDATRFAATGVRLEPEHWRGHALLGINQLRLGAISDGRMSLETAFRGDPYDLWTKNTLDLLDRTDSYETEQSARFILTGPKRETRILAPLLLPIAEQAFDVFAQRYQHRPATPVRIEVYPRHEDFSVRIVGLSAVDVLGVSFGPVIVLESPATGHFGEFNWASALWHEIAHTFHLSMTGGRLPRWAAEGLAVHEEHRARAGWGGDVTPSFLAALHAGRLLPPSRLNEAFLRPNYPEQVNHAYYQGALLIEFIESNFGFDAVAELLQGYANGDRMPALGERVLGISSDALDENFSNYLRQRFAKALRALYTTTSQTPAPANQDSTPAAPPPTAKPDGPYPTLISKAQEALTEKQLDEAIEYLEEAQTLLPEHAGPGSTYRRLAQAYKERGEPLKAAAQLAKNLDINADDLEAHMLLADLLKDTGRGDDPANASRQGIQAALPMLQRALLIQPFEPTLHQRLAESYEQLEDWRAAASAYQAVLELAPTDPLATGYRLARVLRQAGDYRAARKQVLAVLENAPLYADALELLLTIRDDMREENSETKGTTN